MIALIGTMIGFLSTLIPEAVKIFKSKQDNAHELAMLRAQADVQLQLGAMKIEEIGAKVDIEQMKGIYRPIATSGSKFVDALAGSVRPVITYLFFIAYLVVKVAQYNMLLAAPNLPWLSASAATLNWYNIVVTLWGPEDWGLFSSIIAYWFGNRAIDKFRASRK